MKTIQFSGRSWKLHAETPTKLTFVPAANPLPVWREKHSFTQRAAAKHLGISQAQLARIESGTRTCSPEILEIISQFKK